MVRSQEAEKVWLLHYTAVIVAAGRTYYLSAASSMQLLYEAASLLAVLGVHRANKRLLLISDGAKWIHYWFDGLAVKNRLSVLCWHHLKERCWRLIREAIKKKEDRLTVSKEVLSRLWRGEVEEAGAYLSKIILDHEDGLNEIEIIEIKAIEGLKKYLLQREPHIPDYLSRVRAKEWIANTKAEKFNDWSVSVRCWKKNGMKWTSGGVGAIAALEATRRNCELEGWRENGKLPSWDRAVMKAA
jgi:hypothetical protein